MSCPTPSDSPMDSKNFDTEIYEMSHRLSSQTLVEDMPVHGTCVTPTHSQTALIGSSSTAPSQVHCLTGLKLVFVFIAILLTVLLVTLDQTIVATALPSIVAEFDGLKLTAWVATAYFLTNAGLMLAVAQLLPIVSVKVAYLASLLLFETGSVLCGAAPSMGILIFGRAIAGCGCAGIVVCALAAITEFTPLERRPILLAMFGTSLTLDRIVGPLVGGAFTDYVTWRWCFYINLPFGAVAAMPVWLWMPYKVRCRKSFARRSKWGWLSNSMDWIGTILCLGLTTALLLALQYGSSFKSWSDPTVIALFCVFGALTMAFILWECIIGIEALVPFSLATRTQVGASLEAFFLFMITIISVYYLPLWYQVNGRSPIQSGIDILPCALSFLVGAAASSGIAVATDRYWHSLFVGPLVAGAGSGLLMFTTSSTSSSRLIGYQIILGFGVGICFQWTYVAIQVEWADEPEQATRASGVVTFISLFGGIIGLSVAGAIFNKRLAHELGRIPNFPPALTSALQESLLLIRTLPDDLRQEAVTAAVKALRIVFSIPLAAAALAALSSLMIVNRNMKGRTVIPGIAV